MGALDVDALLSAPDFVADPYPAYAVLREHPLVWSESWGAWVLTRYDDCVAALRDPERFSSSGRFQTLLDRLPEDVRSEMDPLYHHYRAGIIQEDPPRHTRLRALVRRPFSAGTVEQTRPQVEAVVDELVGAIEPGGVFDLVSAVSYPLPVTVICEMLGVPVDDRGSIETWDRQISGLQGAGAATPERARAAAEGIVDIEEYFRGLSRERSRCPGDDLMSVMVEAREGDDRLSENELLNMAVTFLLAGHETTMNLFSLTVLNLLRHPDVLASLRQGAVATADIVDEALRYEGPIQRAWRRVTSDVELHDTPIQAGQLVFMMLGAANRDPRMFPDPDRFDPGRPENARHIAFGNGVHFCLGAGLARLEVQVALERLLSRFPRLELAGEIEWNDSIHLHGPRRLPLRGEA